MKVQWCTRYRIYVSPIDSGLQDCLKSWEVSSLTSSLCISRLRWFGYMENIDQWINKIQRFKPTSNAGRGDCINIGRMRSRKI